MYLLQAYPKIGELLRELFTQCVCILYTHRYIAIQLINFGETIELSSGLDTIESSMFAIVN